MIIYLITNKVNGKQYVGQTTRSLKIRWNNHCYIRPDSSAIGRAIRKYGKEAFTIEVIIETDSLEQLNLYEQEYIQKFNTLAPNGYNLKQGGNGHGVSEETRRKLSEAGRGRFHTQEAKEKISIALKGKLFSEEHKKHLSDRQIGIDNHFFGKEHSKETKRKMSETQKKLWAERKKLKSLKEK